MIAITTFLLRRLVHVEVVPLIFMSHLPIIVKTFALIVSFRKFEFLYFRLFVAKYPPYFLSVLEAQNGSLSIEFTSFIASIQP